MKFLTVTGAFSWFSSTVMLPRLVAMTTDGSAAQAEAIAKAESAQAAASLKIPVLLVLFMSLIFRK